MTTPILTTAQKTFKSFIWDPFIMAGETALFTAVPALNAPVLGALDRMLIQDISDYFFNNFIMLLDIAEIKFKDAAHQAAYEKAQDTILIVAHDSGENSDAFKKALADETAALLKFVTFSRNG